MFKLSGIVKDWKESGALQAHVNLYGFWDQETFLTKAGDLGVVLRVKGIDYESLDHASRDHSIKRLEAAFRTLDSRIRVYQTLFKTNEPVIPHEQYANPLVKAAIDQHDEVRPSAKPVPAEPRPDRLACCGEAAIRQFRSLLQRPRAGILARQCVVEAGRQEGVVPGPGVEDGGVRPAAAEHVVGPVGQPGGRELRGQPALFAALAQAGDGLRERALRRQGGSA